MIEEEVGEILRLVRIIWVKEEMREEQGRMGLLVRWRVEGIGYKFYRYKGREESLGKDFEVKTHGTRSSVNPILSDFGEEENRGPAWARQESYITAATMN